MYGVRRAAVLLLMFIFGGMLVKLNEIAFCTIAIVLLVAWFMEYEVVSFEKKKNA